jgi:hypothetical protein
MKNRRLATAAADLWCVFDQLLDVYRSLEDDDGVMCYHGLAERFTPATAHVEDLICFVEKAADRMNRKRAVARKKN